MKYSSFIIRWRATLLVFLTHRLALPALRIIRRPDYFPFTATELATMPADTVGYALAHFLRTRQLELLPYYAKHDVKHVLLNYDATDEGEVCLQCFMLGNGHLSFPVAATVCYGWVTMPEYWSSFRRAFKRGREARPIGNWKWHELVYEPLHTVRARIDNLSKLPG